VYRAASAAELSATHLQDGVLEVVEVDRLEALELRVSTAEVVEQRRHRLVVVVDVADDRLDRLHEPHGVTSEPRVVDQLVAVEVAEAEDGLDERIAAEYQQEDARSAAAEVGRQDLPVLDDHPLVLLGQDDVRRRRQKVVQTSDVGFFRRVARARCNRRRAAHHPTSHVHPMVPATTAATGRSYIPDSLSPHPRCNSPRRPVGLDRLAKSGWNRCSSFGRYAIYRNARIIIDRRCRLAVDSRNQKRPQHDFRHFRVIKTAREQLRLTRELWLPISVL